MKRALIILTVLIFLAEAGLIFWALFLRSSVPQQVPGDGGILTGPVSVDRTAREGAPASQAFRVYVQKESNPEIPLNIDHTVVIGAYAHMGYTYGEMGGVALLKQDGNSVWHVIATDGGVWDVETLVSYGVPRDTAVMFIRTME